MKKIAIVPSLLTTGNFACGITSILLAMQSIYFRGAGDIARSDEMLKYSCFAIFFAMLFDVLDGRVARMTNTTSDFGAELDSLADCVTFGVAPALAVMSLWVQSQPEGAQWYGQVMICGIVYAACAMLRLARYNVEKAKSDKNYFSGLPSPAAAAAVASAVLFCKADYLHGFWGWALEVVPEQIHKSNTVLQMQARMLGVYMLIVGVMMFTRWRFVHVANRFLSGNRRLPYFVILLLAIALFLMHPIEVSFILISVYILVSIITNIPKIAHDIRRELSKGKASADTRPDSAGNDGGTEE